MAAGKTESATPGRGSPVPRHTPQDAHNLLRVRAAFFLAVQGESPTALLQGILALRLAGEQALPCPAIHTSCHRGRAGPSLRAGLRCPSKGISFFSSDERHGQTPVKGGTRKAELPSPCRLDQILLPVLLSILVGRGPTTFVPALGQREGVDEACCISTCAFGVPSVLLQCLYRLPELGCQKPNAMSSWMSEPHTCARDHKSPQVRLGTICLEDTGRISIVHR